MQLRRRRYSYRRIENVSRHSERLRTLPVHRRLAYPSGPSCTASVGCLWNRGWVGLLGRCQISGRVWSPDSVRRTSAAVCMQALFVCRMLYGGLCAGCFRARRVPDIPVDQPAYCPPPTRLVTNVADSTHVRSSTMVKPTPDPPLVPLPSDQRLFHYPGVFEPVDDHTVATRRNAQMPAPPKPCRWQSGRRG